MSETIIPKRMHFSDFIYILYNWRKFLIINLFFILVFTGVIAFSLPKKYRATATIVVAPENTTGGLGGLASLLSGVGNIFSFNTKVLGGGILQEDLILGIMNSRSILLDVVNKFDLFQYYKVGWNKTDIVIKRFKKEISFDPNEFGLIEVSVIHKTPQTAADIANYLVHLADSLNIELNIKRARNHRTYIENRYLRNLEDLRKSEESMSEFQRKYGVFAVPEQVEIAVNVGGELEAELLENQILLHTIEEQFSTHTSMYKNVEMRINALKEKLFQLHQNSLENRESLLIPFQDMPDLQKEYVRKYREVEIQSKLLELIYPLYEQAKMEEQKSIPTVMVVDRAVPPQLKHSPKRLAIIIGIAFVTLFIHVLIILRGHYLFSKENSLNPVERWEHRLFERIIRLYRFHFNH